MDDFPGYEKLKQVLEHAYLQAAAGKGAERHANGKPFTEQPIFAIAASHGLGFLSGQASKKAMEAHVTLLELKGKEAAYAEVLGAIVYLVALAIAIDQTEPQQ